MEFVKELYLSFIVLILLATPMSAQFQLKPARCPTNKIAPHRRVPSWQYNRARFQARTFGGAFLDLLTPDGLRPQELPQNDLQEKPQEDPEDCGDIEDYDETDLSSVSQNLNTRQGKQNQRFFLNLFNRPSEAPPLTTRTRYPTTSPLPALQPEYPTVPPFWSGGFFGDNPYRPPRPENPSDNVKPVHEHDASESQTTYWPSLVGGPLGNVVGFSPFVPTFTADTTTTTRPYTTGTQNRYTTGYPRPRYPNNRNIVGSFVDLLF